MKKVTVAELHKASEDIIKSSTILAVVTVVPDIMAFEQQHGNFTEAQRTFLSRIFRDVALSAVHVHAQLLSDLLIKYDGVPIDDTASPTEEVTGDPAKFEELLRQFGGIKGNA